MVNFLSVLILSILSSQATRLLILKKNMGAIRASALTTVVFCSLYMASALPDQKLMHTAILGGTFLGMTEIHRLRNRDLILAAVTFSAGFIYILPLNPGFGGALGVIAMSSCILTWLTLRIYVQLKGTP